MRTILLQITGLLILLIYPLQILAYQSGSKKLEIQGTVLGYDGKPIDKGHVMLGPATTSTVPEIWKTVEVDTEGHYYISIKTDEHIPYTLIFTGANHKPHWILIADSDQEQIQVNVQLGTYTFKNEIVPHVLGSFNNFSIWSTKPMEKREDGTFIAIVAPTADSVAYQIHGVVMGTMINNMGTDYNFFSKYNYRSNYYLSVVRNVSEDSVKIVFDPSVYPQGKDPRITIQSEDKILSRLSAIYEEVLARKSRALMFRTQRLKFQEVTSAWKADVENLEQRILSEKNPRVKQAQLFSYILMRGLGARIDSNLAQQALRDISPKSRIWSWDPNAISFAVDLTGGIRANKNYLLRMVGENPSGEVRATVLLKLVQETHARNEKEFRNYYGRLLSEFPDSRQAVRAVREYAPESTLQVGSQLPDFSLKTLDEPGLISTKAMKGKFYLINFWASWCGYSIGEMDVLHEAYKRYHDKGLEILSISFDDKVEHIEAFQYRTEWDQPWIHSYVETGFSSEIADLFSVTALPKPILIDTDGKVIALGDQLRGDLLLEFLSNYIK